MGKLIENEKSGLAGGEMRFCAFSRHPQSHFTFHLLRHPLFAALREMLFVSSFAPLDQAYCRACGKIVRVPDRLPISLLSELVRLRRIGEPVEAIKKLRANLPMDLAEAKIFIIHLTHKPGLCNRRRRPIEGSGPIIECKRCRALRLTFENRAQKEGYLVNTLFCVFSGQFIPLKYSSAFYRSFCVNGPDFHLTRSAGAAC